MQNIPATMRAMVLTGHGDLDKYHWHEDWPTPQPAAGEVLVKVAACGLNNTDVNTRSGWYSSASTGALDGTSEAVAGASDPSWGGQPIRFPRIQGADVCGYIVGVGEGVEEARIGQRVITDNWLRDPQEPENLAKAGYFGSERDGGFADYTTLPSINALAVTSDLEDAELATFSCSFSTAEGMLQRAGLNASDTVLIPGASGGVGTALIQLAKLRGARVIALASAGKHQAVAALGPDRLLDRGPDNLAALLADEKITVVADIVGGPHWPEFIGLLQRGGRYCCSGAIAGPQVAFDLRPFYLRDLSFFGSTVTGPHITRSVLDYIEAGALKPMLAGRFALSEMPAAQRAFMAKQHTGSLVVCP